MAPTQLQIKINALTRLMKEQTLYVKEVQQHEERISKMKSEGADEYEIKKMNEVLQDTKQMIPDLHRRVQSTLDGLKSYIVRLASGGWALPRPVAPLRGDRLLTLNQEKGGLDEDLTIANEKIAEAESFLSKN